MELREAKMADLADIMQILTQARNAQREMGFEQWKDNYPPEDLVATEIDRGEGYVLAYENQLAGYAAITESDPEYDRLSEIWEASGRYCAVHRIALADQARGQGLSRQFFDLIEEQARMLGADIIRIDTGTANAPMQHILSKRGYNNLGNHNFVWGERSAFELVIRYNETREPQSYLERNNGNYIAATIDYINNRDINPLVKMMLRVLVFCIVILFLAVSLSWPLWWHRL